MTKREPRRQVPCWKYPKRRCPNDCLYALADDECLHDLGDEQAIKSDTPRLPAVMGDRVSCEEATRLHLSDLEIESVNGGTGR